MDLWHILYRQFQMSYMFPFVEGDVFVGVVWDEITSLCFSFDVMNSTNNVYVGLLPFFWVLIANEVGCMSLNFMSFDLHRYDTILSGQYLKDWFQNSDICLLFTVSSVGKESTFILYVEVIFSVPGVR